MRTPRRPAELQGKIFPVDCAARGGVLTPDQLRSRAWQRLHRGAYADSNLPRSHGLRCAGAHLVIPGTAAVGGRSAAWFYGITLLGPDDPVEVVVPPADRFGRVVGLRIHRTDLPPTDVTPGTPALTTPERTAWDIARFHPVPEALAYLDAMAAQRLISGPALAERLAATTIRWGRKRAGRAISLIDAKAESPQESRLRGHLALADIPAPVVQHQVYAGARFLARVDLGWPERRVAVEYDGVWHGNPAQLHHDRRRLNLLVGTGWRVLHVTSARMATDLPGVIREVRGALGL